MCLLCDGKDKELPIRFLMSVRITLHPINIIQNRPNTAKISMENYDIARDFRVILAFAVCLIQNLHII